MSKLVRKVLFCSFLIVQVTDLLDFLLVKMDDFTNSEMADMHFVYGMAHGNARAARRMYQLRYPRRHVPNKQTFINIHSRLCERGNFKRSTARVGRPRRVRTVQIEEAVLNEIEAHPETSTRKIAAQLNITHVLVWNILREQQLYPYHIQRVQALLPRDFPQRVALCTWIQNKLVINPRFLSQVLFTDEASFSRNAIINFHNNHMWAEENPHAVIENNFQENFSVNVWVGIVGDFLIGPHFLPPRLNGNRYRQFIEYVLPDLLEDIPIIQRRRIWFMHDGAPPHFSIVARQYLNQNYADRWIGRAGPQPWPPRSPDINPLDFFLWGHLKSLVYRTPVQNEEDLRNRIQESCEIIRNTPGIFERVRQSMIRRINACIEVGGCHFQQLL